MGLLPLSIGFGLVISLIFSEIFGLVAGGMVVPGYIAMFLTNPLAVALTLAAGFVTFAVVQALSSFIIVYGKRRTVLMILVGYLIGAMIRWLIVAPNESLQMEHTYSIIGYIIPGLIAIWLDRQGVVETFAALLTASVVVRLLLILFVGTELSA